jgi:ribosomal protein S18 acetylase RimI-like enzyme
LTSSSIKSHQKVLALLQNRAEHLETFETYAPAHRFIEAVVTETNLSFSVRDEDGSIFAMALGENPVLLQADRIATSRGIVMDRDLYKHRADWDFYSIDTDGFALFDQATESKDDLGIKQLLETHAPNSSVWPGNEEVIFWGELREGSELVAAGTLVKWRTGEVMFASIATHADFRGKGLAQTLVKQMLSSAANKGIGHVGLGVFAGNIAAKKAYEKVGFKLIGEFSSYQLTTLD